MSCCGGSCGCGANCKCGNGCGGCKSFSEFSFGDRAVAAPIFGETASDMAYEEESGPVGGENGGCGCGSGGCNCGPNCGCSGCSCCKK